MAEEVKAEGSSRNPPFQEQAIDSIMNHTPWSRQLSRSAKAEENLIRQSDRNDDCYDDRDPNYGNQEDI